MLLSMTVVPVSAISDKQKSVISEHCDAMKDDLRSAQKIDSRTRVYLGGYYETILTKYITPLNVRLVENNLSTASLVENQNKFAEAKTSFVNDFISYQQDLEALVNTNCKSNPEEFYDKLVKVRQKRKTVEQETAKIRNLLTNHIKLVTGLKEKM